MPILFLTFVILAVLKSTEILAISWWIVALPLIPAAIILGLPAIIFVGLALFLALSFILEIIVDTLAGKAKR